MGIHDVPKTELIERAAKELQKVNAVQPPQWTLFAKTGTFKERQPVRDDWWFVRAAAILRRLASSEGPIGVQKLRTLYGGKKNRGHAPERFYKGSGSILRKILQQLDKAGLSKKVEKGLHKGRIITPQGHSFLGKIADAYMKEKNIVLPKRPEGELAITELPKEKKPRAPRKRVAKATMVEMTAPAVTPAAEGMPAATPAAPKRRRAPRKKAEAPAALSMPAAEAAPATPAPAAPAATDQTNQPANQ